MPSSLEEVYNSSDLFPYKNMQLIQSNQSEKEHWLEFIYDVQVPEQFKIIPQKGKIIFEMSKYIPWIRHTYSCSVP